MTIQQMILWLLSNGWTQQSIAAEAGTTQPTIHRAAKGAGVRYETGKSIERIFQAANTARADSGVKSPEAA